MTILSIEHLAENEVMKAWPLLRLTGAERVGSWWESEARDLLRRGGGILVARVGDGAIHGLATYEAIGRPRGPTLTVRQLISFELSRKEPAKHALCDALDRIARALGCRAIALPMAANGFVGYHPSRAGDEAPPTR